MPQIGWLGAGIAAAVLSLGFAVHARRDLGRANDGLADASTDLEGVKARTRALQATKWPVDDLLAGQIVQAAEAPPVAVLIALDKTLPDDVKLESLIMTYGKQVEVEMRVTARRSEGYDEFLTRLDASPSFQNVVPAAENRAGVVTATVRARFRGPA
jgi:Tfp pilus assembly protein PilN